MTNYIPSIAKEEAIEHELISHDQVLKEVHKHIAHTQARMKKVFWFQAHREGISNKRFCLSQVAALPSAFSHIEKEQ